MSGWSELFRGKASVYALDETTKQWVDRGTGGTLCMYLNNQYRSDVRIKWSKNQRDLWWRLMAGKLKPKGDRAWVLKAWETMNNQQEILAIRFADNNFSNLFSQKYHVLFPEQPMQPNGQFPPNHRMSYQQGYPANNGTAALHLQGRTSANNIRANNHPTGLNMNAHPVRTLADNHKNIPQSAPVNPHQAWVNNVSQSEKRLVNRGRTVWECAVCTYSNEANKPACQMCGLSAEASDKARASGNSNNNPNQFNNAPMIPQSPAVHNGHGLPQVNIVPPMQNGLQGGGNGWGCGSCTFVNTDQSLQCGVCGAKKPQGNNGGNVNGNGGGGGGASSAFSFKSDPINPYLPQTKPQKVLSAPNGVGRVLSSGPYQNQMGHKMPGLNKQAKSMPPSALPSALPRVMSPHSGNVYNGIPQSKSMHMKKPMFPNVHPQLRNENGSTWICPICTLHNSLNVARCDACHTARASSGGLGLDGNNNNNNNNNMSVMNAQRMGGNGHNPLLPNVGPAGVQHMAAMMPTYPLMPNNPMGGYGNGGFGGMGVNMMPHQMGGGNRGGNRGGMPQMGGMNVSNNMNVSMIMNQQMGIVQRDKNGKLASSRQEFQRAASDIACYNDNPSSVFSTLRSVAKKLLKDDVRYRTLDTTNPKVMERLIGFEGVLDFLMLLGFESDAMGMKLVCEQKPSQQIVRNAIEVLNSYESRLGVGRAMKRPNGANGKDDDVESHATLGGPGDNMNGGGSAGNNNQVEEDTLTLEQIILWSTHESMRDNDTMETLIITHKTITESILLLKQLRRRFHVPIPQDIRNDKKAVQSFKNNVQKRIQLKVIKSLRDWMKKFWEQDFDGNEEMQKELSSWLTELKQSKDDSTWIGPLANTVSKEFDRYIVDGSPHGNRVKNNPLPTFDNVSIPKKYSTSTISAEDLAEQLTLMDYRIFSRIEARECLGQAWKKKTNQQLAPNILGMIQQFNNLTVFVQIQILRERSLRERGKAMKRVIKMGQKFQELRNYNSLCAVFSALNSAPIHRLKLAWKKVPEKQIEIFNQFKVIFARDFNHRNLRQIFRNTSPPSIPHIGLFLQDLVFIDDGNSTKVEIANLKNLAGGNGSMVNFNKCVRVYDRIRNIRLYQDHPYQLNEKPVVQKILLQEFEKLKQVTEDQIWDMSSEIKKQDERDQKKAIF